MSSASCSFKSDSTSFTDHYEECMKNLSAAKTAIEHSRVDAGKDLDDIRLQIEGSREATNKAIVQSRRETDRAIEQSRVDSKMEITQMRLDATKRMDLMEKEARFHNKKVDDKLASIPSESTVNEWARTATHD